MIYDNIKDIIKIIIEGGGIATFLYFLIRGLKREIAALNETIKYQNQIVEAVNKRMNETEKMAESYKKWWEELQDNYEKHKNALTKAKNEYINELEKAIKEKDEKLKAKLQSELEIISMKEEVIEELKQQTEEKERELNEMVLKIQNSGTHDQLTGTYNRYAVERHITKFIKQHIPFDIIAIDIDNFKGLNDQYGHRIGDTILVEAAKKIIMHCSKNEIIGRIGGDEFLIIIPSNNLEDTKSLAIEIFRSITEGILIEDYNEIINKMVVKISMAIIPWDEKIIKNQQLFYYADNLIYSIKKEGGNMYKVYESETEEKNN